MTGGWIGNRELHLEIGRCHLAIISYDVLSNASKGSPLDYFRIGLVTILNNLNVVHATLIYFLSGTLRILVPENWHRFLRPHLFIEVTKVVIELRLERHLGPLFMLVLLITYESPWMQWQRRIHLRGSTIVGVFDRENVGLRHRIFKLLNARAVHHGEKWNQMCVQTIAKLIVQGLIVCEALIHGLKDASPVENACRVCCKGFLRIVTSQDWLFGTCIEICDRFH